MRPWQRERPLLERILSRIQVTPDGCWIWTGARQPNGYGVTGRGRRGEGNVMVHRAAYELLVGPIPEGLHLDHLCRVRPCCNPEHLEPVTQAENNRRAGHGKVARRGTCPRGHPLEHVRTLSSGKRYCPACRRERYELEAQRR